MDNPLFFFIIISFKILFGVLSSSLAKARNRNTVVFFIVGFVFGLLGFLILYFIPCKEEKISYHKDYKELKETYFNLEFKTQKS
jgi:hypothetical protein